MRIQNNLMAMNTHRMYSKNNKKVSASAEKLSSGYKINRAADDAAGLAISEKMRAQVRGLNMASKNSQDAISLIQTAEGAMQEMHSILQRMNELANQSATGTNQTFDRQQIDAEFNQLKGEIDDIAEQTNFNNMKLLDGSLASGASSVRTTAGTMQANSTFSDGAGGPNYTVTNLTGLSSQVGAYVVTDGGNGKISVEFTETGTSNITNTEIDLNKVTSGNFGNGGAFKVDLSAAGLGTFEISADSTGTVSATNLAAAMAAGGGAVLTTTNLGASTAPANIGGQAVTYTASDKTPKGTYTITASGDTITIKDQDGNTGTHTFTALATDPADFSLDLSAFNIGGKIVDLGSYSATGATGTPSAAAQATAFNGVVITGAASEGGGALKIQVGANEGEQLAVSIEKVSTKGLGISASSIADQEAAGKAITATQNAINLVSEQRATLGAIQNRLEHKISNLDNTSENLSSSESRIRDVDIAKEMTEYTKNNVLSQAATAMLAQANASTQGVLSLLQG